ncbi:uncharacterized protein SPPG_08361 [Spizellomyces punctatus DAOM BR117]|uniref:Uncharacterized protein n=1 Tax=Spizellomyces punctatus (strain DAOM BR117) TaxID=645134 RepID=A0A0L0H668_SPIPD|nr:uncharacterized protein SPPG_08361 [Spizellomyces punctatus DAOM BR117]KNC96208.1 hypothetical protein SPPG_08361 [Spizellomyces punctatus DAOM BR117]|eukprot:XP_016604248.1 hypothetical protein SPPG_08361 [Spizellomyces punctatus DAOM BR117]
MNYISLLLTFNQDHTAQYSFANAATLPDVNTYPADIWKVRKEKLGGNGRWPYKPTIQIVRPRLRRILQMLSGSPCKAEWYREPFYRQEDAQYAILPSPHRGVVPPPSQGEDDAGGYDDQNIQSASEEELRGEPEEETEETTRFDIETAPVDLRPALFAAFTEEELTTLSEIILDIGRPASVLTYTGVRKEFSDRLGRRQILCAASGITFNKKLCRGSFPDELHQIGQKLVRERGKTMRSLVGLTIRVDREIYGLAELLQDVISSTDSLLFLGPPNADRAAVFRDVCAYTAEMIDPKTLAFADTSHEITGGDVTDHPCLGKTRVFGSCGSIENLMRQILNHTPFVVAMDQLTSPLEIQAISGMKYSHVRVIATSPGSFEHLISHAQKNFLLGGIMPARVSDKTAWKGGKNRLFRVRQPIFETIVEIISKTEFRIFRNVQDLVDNAVQSQPISIERRWIDENGVLRACFTSISISDVAITR